MTTKKKPMSQIREKVKLISTFIILLSLILVSTNAQIQSQKKLTINTTAPEPVLLVPSANSKLTFDHPISLFGKALPGATVTVHITPISKGGTRKTVLIVKGQQNPYNVQDYTVTASETGTWNLKDLNIKFYAGTTQRRVQFFLAQQLGIKKSKGFVTEFKWDNDLQLINAGTINLNKKYILTITLNSINDNKNDEAVKLGLSQWSDVLVNGGAISNRTSESNEIICWWEGVCAKPRLFKNTTNVDNSRSYSIQLNDINNSSSPVIIDIWTKYIAMYPVSKTDISALNIIAPHTLFDKKTVHLKNDKGIQHDKIIVKDVISNGGSMNKDIRINFNDRVFKINYTITAKPE